MNTTPSRKTGKQKPDWPKEVQPGRTIVRVYRRTTPQGHFAFMVANYADGKNRRFDSYASEADALAAADTLARRLDARDYVAAAMTQAEALEYANAVTRLKPFNVTVDAGTAALAEVLKIVGDLANLHAAARFYKERHKTITKKSITDAVAEFLKLKESRGMAMRYREDLNYRLGKFSADFQMDVHSVTTALVQEWLDTRKDDKGKPLSPQSYTNFRRVLSTFFKFAVARGYAVDNPLDGAERVKVRNGESIQIFTPAEIARLLMAATPDFLPSLAIGAFAGLRSAEIERLTWQDIDLVARLITVGASQAKTGSRRLVPVSDNLAAWLDPYAGRQGRVWEGSSDMFYRAQEATADATAVAADEAKGVKAQKAVTWKSNALRHSYASYRLAQIGDAGRLSGEMGNSAAMIFRHYRELVKPEAAQRWFSVKPEGEASNVLPMPAASVAQ
ncbi:MAG: tyrosine-type recombinase/integrase [Verrucomicrobia bacterium]|nr:tyrosine-type recombinase/integrase [Verrucomicrobiota bacterium]